MLLKPVKKCLDGIIGYFRARVDHEVCRSKVVRRGGEHFRELFGSHCSLADPRGMVIQHVYLHRGAMVAADEQHALGPARGDLRGVSDQPKLLVVGVMP